MNKRIALLFIFLLVSLLINPKNILSSECSFETLRKDSSEAAISRIKTICEQDITVSGQKITDLSAQIQGMNAKINLTMIQIQETGQKIVKTQEEIETLNSRIEGLDTSLNYLSKLLLQKIVEGYKNRGISILSVFLDSENASEFLNRFKYLKTAQDNNQRLLIQVQQAKLNYEDQKKLREKKKIELDNLKIVLNEQKNTLNAQKIQKQKLLDDTKNGQQLYQQVLTQAQRQLAAFKSFVQTSGFDTVIGANALGNGSDGAYYSQRDARWAYKTIGYSSENVLNVGCLLTSVAIVAKKYGQDVTPLDIASDVNRFYGFTAYMSLPWKPVAGKAYHGGINVDEELQNGNYVIAGVGSCGGYGGSHFIVLTKKEGNDYIMHDPIYGPDLKLSSHYSSYFCSTAVFK